MRRTLTALTALIAAAVAVVVAATPAPAAAHPQRTTYTVTSTASAGPTPHFPAFDPTSGHVLVSNVSANTVTELEFATGPARTFATGTTPHTVVVDDATRRAFVTNKGAASVSIIDIDTGTVTSFAVGPNPHGLAVDTDYRRLYVTSIDADRLEVYDLGTLAPITTVPVGDGPWGVSVGPGRIAVTDTAADTVHLLDRDTLQVRDVVTVGAGPWNSTFLGGTLYVTLERTGEVVAVRGGRVAWRVPSAPRPTASSPTTSATPSSPRSPARTPSPSSTPAAAPSCRPFPSPPARQAWPSLPTGGSWSATSTPASSPSSPPADMAEPPSGLSARIATAETALDEATGGRPLCGPPDRPTAEIKRREGALAALMDLRRAIAAATPGREAEAVEAVRRRWDTPAATSRGPDWQAYHQGASAALADTTASGTGDSVARRPGAAVPEPYRHVRFTVSGDGVECDCGRAVARQDMVVEQVTQDGDRWIVAVECLACGVKGHLTVDTDTVDDVSASFPQAAPSRSPANPR